MKIGVISSSTFGKYKFQDFLKTVTEIGFQCFELPVVPDPLAIPLGIHQNTVDVRLGNLARIKKEIASYGIEVCAIGCFNDFSYFDEEAMANQVRKVKKCCDIAQFFGCNVVRVFGTLRNGRRKPVVTIKKNQWIDLIVEGFKKCVDYAESAGIFLALENHGTITNDANIELEIFEKVGSKYLRKNVDTANYLWPCNDLKTVHGFLKKLAPYAAHTHLKDAVIEDGKYKATVLGEGQIDIESFIKELKACDYKGPLCIEYEVDEEDRRRGCTKSLDFLKKTMSRVWPDFG